MFLMISKLVSCDDAHELVTQSFFKGKRMRDRHSITSNHRSQHKRFVYYGEKTKKQTNKTKTTTKKQNKTKHAPLNICYVATVAQQMLYSTLRHVEYRRRAIYKAQTLLKRNRSTLYWTTNKNIKEFIIAIISHLTSKNIVDSICWVTT